MIYINGIKASKTDLKTLAEYVNNGKIKILSITTTKKGNTSIKTN